MRRRIYLGILLVALPCVAALSIALIYLLYGERDAGEVIAYLAIAITVAVVFLIIALITGNYIARKLTNDIVKSLEGIASKEYSISTYDELMQFAVDNEQRNRYYNSKIDELSGRTETIETITENMQEGLILIDAYGVVLSANESAHRVFGKKIEKRNIKHIHRDSGFQKAVKKCIDGENAKMQIQRDDKVYTVFFSPVFSRAGTRGGVILLHDTTESHIAEKQRREFSANVSHELKTPLTTISALAEMIWQGMAKEDDIKVFAERIKEQSGRLLMLIDDIIRLSEFDEGKTNRENTVFNLWDIAETVIKAFDENNYGVEVLLTGESFDISANHRMIDELLYNLIDNGVKYNKENGTVTVNLSHDNSGMCTISVSDTGIGIDNEHKSRVFERFYRVDMSRSKKTGGTGLGLSIVKHITEFYKGRLELESTEGAGTTITCYLDC